MQFVKGKIFLTLMQLINFKLTWNSAPTFIVNVSANAKKSLFIPIVFMN